MNFDYGECLLAECSEAGVLTVTLNRPARKNAFDGSMRHAIRKMLLDVKTEDRVRAPLGAYTPVFYRGKLHARPAVSLQVRDAGGRSSLKSLAAQKNSNIWATRVRHAHRGGYRSRAPA